MGRGSKSLFVAFLFLMVVPSIGFAQGMNGKPVKPAYMDSNQIPEYLMAEDANPVVLVSFKSAKSSKSEHFAAYDYEIKELKNPIYQHDSVPVIGVKNIIYDDFKPRLASKLEEIGVEPKAIMNYGDFKSANVYNNYIDNRVRKLLYDNNSRCIIHVHIYRYPSKKKVEKGRAKDRHYKTIRIAVDRYKGGSVYYDHHYKWSDFGIRWYPLDRVVNKLKDKIDKKRANYFFDSIPGQPYYETKRFQPYKIHFSFPDDLNEKTLWVPDSPNIEATNELYKERMMEFYPYAWMVVDNQGTYRKFRQNIDEKYILEAKYTTSNFTEISDLDNNWKDGIDTYSGTKVSYFFSVRNVYTGANYYGTYDYKKTGYSGKAIENFAKLVKKKFD